jgi:hypothetical protein
MFSSLKDFFCIAWNDVDKSVNGEMIPVWKFAVVA